MANTDLMAFLSTLVLLATISTTIFAVAAYAVSRGYLKRKPKVRTAPASTPHVTVAAKASHKPARILRRYDPFHAAGEGAVG